MTEGHRRPSILLGSSFPQWLVAGISSAHVGQSSAKSRPDRHGGSRTMMRYVDGSQNACDTRPFWNSDPRRQI